jgi:Zn-dependent peptidase ImmA (M78 family)
MNERREASEAAERVLAEYWDGTVPVDPAWIAQSMGIRVVDAYMDADVDGAIRREGKEKPAFIYLNAHNATTRKRFTCAHEIAHYVKHSEDGEYEFIDYRDALASTGQISDERYANAFAAALLMPAKHVRRLRDEGLDEWSMARRLGVSEAAMVNRLKNLGLYRR